MNEFEEDDLMRRLAAVEGWIETLRKIGVTQPPAQPIGCICPPTCEQTCQRVDCPRRGLYRRPL